MSFRRSPKIHPVTLRASLQAKRFPRFEWCQHVHSNNPATSFATLGMSRTWQPLVHVGGIISVGRGITGCITKTLANKDNRVSVVPNYRIWTTLLDSSQPTTRISMQLDQNTTPMQKLQKALPVRHSMPPQCTHSITRTLHKFREWATES